MKSQKFCKLYEKDDRQIVVMVMTDEENKPILSLFFKPDDKHEVSQINLHYNSMENAENAFIQLTEEQVYTIVEKIIKEYI